MWYTVCTLAHGVYMKIAVVGAGFCGLACAWHLADIANVVLFDKKGIGAGASGITAGLMHPYAGPKAQASWNAHAAINDSMHLLEQASVSHGSPVFSSKGILRPQTAGMDFSQAINYPDVEWWNVEQCQKLIPELNPLPGLFVRSGVTVHCPSYIKGLWLACQQKQVTFQIANIIHPSDLTGFDYIIFTVGAGQNALQGISAPPVSLIKGQTLKLKWQNTDPLPFTVNAGVQFAMVEQKSVWAGATYERKWTTEEPDDKAEEEIRRKLNLISPAFSELPLLSIWTGLRAATGDKKPFITHTAPNVYCLGGMGSKGLLYHAYMAKQLLTCVRQREFLLP